MKKGPIVRIWVFVLLAVLPIWPDCAAAKDLHVLASLLAENRFQGVVEAHDELTIKPDHHEVGTPENPFFVGKTDFGCRTSGELVKWRPREDSNPQQPD